MKTCVSGDSLDKVPMYKKMSQADGSVFCSGMYAPIKSTADCEAAMKALNFTGQYTKGVRSGNWRDWPVGCFYNNYGKGVHLNAGGKAGPSTAGLNRLNTDGKNSAGSLCKRKNSGTCQERVYVLSKTESLSEAVKKVNAECSSQCSCTDDDFEFHGAAAYHLVAHVNTTITLSGEVIAPDGNSDSFYVWWDKKTAIGPVMGAVASVSGGEIWNVHRTTKWAWRDVTRLVNRRWTKATFQLTPGVHILYIAGRERGTLLRNIKITSGDADFVHAAALDRTPWGQDWLDGGKTKFTRATCSAREAFWNKKCGVSDVKSLFVEGEQGTPSPQGVPYKFTETAVPESSAGFKQPTSGTSFYQKEVYVKQGNFYVDTQMKFERPVDVSVKIKQTDGNDECGVIAVFPQKNTRHSGYNAGIGWWHKYFGAGVDGSIKRYGASGTTKTWHTVRIWASDDGKVYFYLDGKLQQTITDNKYQSGVIRLGSSCRNYQYKDLVVKGGVPLGHWMSRELTVGDCQARCKSTKGCGSFSYWRSGACHIAPPGASSFTSANVTAGSKSCGEEELQIDGIVSSASRSGSLLGDEHTTNLQTLSDDVSNEEQHMMPDGSFMDNADMSDPVYDVEAPNNGDQGSSADGDQSSDGTQTSPWSPDSTPPDPQPDVSDGTEGMPTGRNEQELLQEPFRSGTQMLGALFLGEEPNYKPDE
jgi:hypothetical protein